MRIGLAFGLLAATLMACSLSGCETADQGPPIAAVTATVTNNTGKVVSRIMYQVCGSAPDSWSPITGIGPLGTGSVTFTLPAACVNLNAYYADDKLAGSQRGVRRDFPFKWVIS